MGAIAVLVTLLVSTACFGMVTAVSYRDEDDGAREAFLFCLLMTALNLYVIFYLGVYTDVFR